MEQWHRATKWAKRSSGNLLWTKYSICSNYNLKCCCIYCRQQIQVENEMECGDVVKRRSLKAMGGAYLRPPWVVTGVLEGYECCDREWGAEKSRGTRMDPCKQQCLRCERSVVHSGKSLSHAGKIVRTSSDETVKAFWSRTGDWYIWGRSSGNPRGSHTKRPGSEMERMETGTVWLTLKVPLTLSPHWIPGLTQLQGTQS